MFEEIDTGNYEANACGALALIIEINSEMSFTFQSESFVSEFSFPVDGFAINSTSRFKPPRAFSVNPNRTSKYKFSENDKNSILDTSPLIAFFLLPHTLKIETSKDDSRSLVKLSFRFIKIPFPPRMKERNFH